MNSEVFDAGSSINVRNGQQSGQDTCPLFSGKPTCLEKDALHITKQFNELYEGKMREIDLKGGGDCIQAKISLQQNWIKDLTEQNEMLVKAVEELEYEATERVQLLEEKLKQSAEVLKRYSDIDFSNNLNGTLQRAIRLQNDNRTLITFIKRGRKTNIWTIKDLKLNETCLAELGDEPCNETICQCSIDPGLRQSGIENNTEVSRFLRVSFEIVENKNPAASPIVPPAGGTTMSNTNFCPKFNSTAKDIERYSTGQFICNDCGSHIKTKSKRSVSYQDLKGQNFTKASSKAQTISEINYSDGSEKVNINEILHFKELTGRDIERELLQIDQYGGIEKVVEKVRSYDALEKSLKDMREALTAEVAEKHDGIVGLRRDVQQLEDQLLQADKQIHFKDDIVRELRKEIKQLKQQQSFQKRSSQILSSNEYATSSNFDRNSCIVIEDSGHFINHDTGVPKPSNSTIIYIREHSPVVTVKENQQTKLFKHNLVSEAHFEPYLTYSDDKPRIILSHYDMSNEPVCREKPIKVKLQKTCKMKSRASYNGYDTPKDNSFITQTGSRTHSAIPETDSQFAVKQKAQKNKY